MLRRVLWVEYAKAIGIILVVYGHVARGIHTAGLPINPDFFKITDAIIYSFHMPLFFFLSGLFLIHSLEKRGRMAFIASKLSTVVYPYLLWSILQGIIEVKMNSYTNAGIDIVDMMPLLYQPRAQFWFLYALSMIFVFSALVYRSYKYSFAISVFIVAAIAYIFNNHIPSAFNLVYLKGYFVYFAFGVLFSFWKNQEVLGKKATLFILFVIFVLGQILYQNIDMFTDIYVQNIIKLASTISAILFVASSTKYLSGMSLNFLINLGRYSLPIYLMHIIFGSGTRIILFNIFHVTSAFIHTILGCLIGIIAPLMIATIINKYKIHYIFSFPTKST